MEEKAPVFVGVAASGPGAGKDTVSAMVARLLEGAGHTVAARKFATPIREVIERVTGIPVAASETTAGKSIGLPALGGITVGRFLQKLGAAGRNGVHPDIWLLPTMASVPRGASAVFSDVRYPNEAAAIRERGGFVIMVAPAHLTAERGKKALAGRDPGHESEKQDVRPDHTVTNDRLEGLEPQVVKILRARGILPASE